MLLARKDFEGMAGNSISTLRSGQIALKLNPEEKVCVPFAPHTVENCESEVRPCYNNPVIQATRRRWILSFG